jgi:hypothetical protein
MGRIFEPAQHVTSWRRLAPYVWDRPHDPTVYGVMDLVVDRALPYLDELAGPGYEGSGTHLVTKGSALASMIRKRTARYPPPDRLRRDVDILQVATEGVMISGHQADPG